VLEAYGCGVPVVGSNTSSVAELVIPELSCDPEQPESIAAAMERLHGTPGLRARSVAHGRQLLASFGWKPSAAAVMATLTDRPRSLPAVTGAALAVVTAQPSHDSGSTLEAGLESASWRTDFFVAGSGPRMAPSPPLRSGNRHLPVEVLRKALDVGSYGTVLFVLGNSAADVPVLKAVMQTRLGCRSQRIAYLRDADLTTLVEAFLGRPLTTETGIAGRDAMPWLHGMTDPASSAATSLRFLLEMGALDGIVVASHARRDHLRALFGSTANRCAIDVVAPETVGATLCGTPRMPKAVALASRG
jgi:hypothetical protein